MSYRPIASRLQIVLAFAMLVVVAGLAYTAAEQRMIAVDQAETIRSLQQLAEDSNDRLERGRAERIEYQEGQRRLVCEVLAEVDPTATTQRATVELCEWENR